MIRALLSRAVVELDCFTPAERSLVLSLVVVNPPATAVVRF